VHLVGLSHYTYIHPTHLTLQHSIMLYRTNGIVHSLMACSKDRPALCQELTWTSHSQIKNQQQNVKVQCRKPTARAGQSQCRNCCYGNIKTVLPSQEVQLKWGEIKLLHRSMWTSLAVATLPTRVAVCKRLQSHRPEWVQLKAPRSIQWYNRWVQLFGYMVQNYFLKIGYTHVSEWGGQKHLVRDRKGQWGSKGSCSCYNIATCAWQEHIRFQVAHNLQKLYRQHNEIHTVPTKPHIMNLEPYVI
jgi:hypothetical protein